MSESMRRRWTMVAIGAGGGLALWGLAELAPADAVDDKLIAGTMTAVAAFVAALLLLIGPLAGRRALASAALLGLVSGGLMLLMLARFDSARDLLDAGVHVPVAMAAFLLSLPFLITAAGPGWRDYPALFQESWSLIGRSALGWMFPGVTWAVILLSDALLDIVGIGALGRLVEWGAMPLLITGAALGLGMAILGEPRPPGQPHLVGRLVWLLAPLRLLAPVVLAVSVVFVLGVLVQGFSGLFVGYSAATVITAVAAVAITLVTLVAGQDDADVPENTVLRGAARGLALVAPVLAGLALAAVMQRVGQYGWTPERLMAAMLAAVALCHGLAYLVAVLRGPGWMARVRRANLWLALGMIGLAVLWQTPVLNAERISARSQLARALAGATPDGRLAWELEDWGRPGQAALVELLAAAEARPELAGWLGPVEPAGEDTTALQAEVRAVLPLQPATASATRDAVLGLMRSYELQEVLDNCAERIDAAPGCVMVVADLWPDTPGDEAVLARNMGRWAALELLAPERDYLVRVHLRRIEGEITDKQMRRLIVDWQKAPPEVVPVRLNQLGTGPRGLFAAP
ncbi:MAG: DUF4153 domain-containing protein [Paracoccaceae bacterium]